MRVVPLLTFVIWLSVTAGALPAPAAPPASGPSGARIEHFAIVPSASMVAYRVGETFFTQNRFKVAIGTTAMADRRDALINSYRENREDAVPGVTRRALIRAAALGWPAAMLARGLIGRGRVEDAVAAAPSGRGRWTTRAPLPLARTEVGVATVNGKVYVLGGYASGRVDQPFNQEYDPASNTWQERAPMPRGLNHVAAAGLNGKVYACGGFIEQNRNAVADVYEYDVALDRWRALAPLPQKLGAAAALPLAGKLHVIGGRDVISVGTHQVYDPAANTWTQRAPLPQGRDHLGLVAVGGLIHAVGGRFNTFDYNTSLHDAYDPSGDAWSSRAPLPTARSGVAAAVLNGWVFVFGGGRAGGVFSENEAYDPTTDRWMTMTPMLTPRHGTGAAVVGGAIYIPAGGLVNGGSRPSTVNEVFTLA